MNLEFKNWRTTLAGIGLICTAVGSLLGQVTGAGIDMNHLPTDLMGLFGGVGLIFAKDGRVTGGTIPQAGGTIPANTEQRKVAAS